MFKPRSIPLRELDKVHLELRELEALRSCDLDGADQETAAEAMGVSRGTVQRLLTSGRTKLVGAVVNNAALLIEGGNSDENLRTGRRKGRRVRGR